MKFSQIIFLISYVPLFFVQQVKDVLFEPVRKTQDAMYFVKTPDDMWMPCGPRQPGAVQITMQELAAKGLASKVIRIYPPPLVSE